MAKKYSFTLLVLAALFCTSILVSNIIAGKLWNISPLGIVLTAGVITFPIVYIIGDVVPEVYGYPTARKLIYLGFAMNLFAVVFFYLTLRMAYPPYFAGQASFEAVLGFTPRLLLASFTAYLIGTNVNAFVLVQVKKLTGAKLLWVRTISSTIVGESIDSLVFISIAFFGVVPNAALPMMIIGQASFKIIYEIVATPFTYIIVNYVKGLEGIPKGSVQVAGEIG